MTKRSLDVSWKKPALLKFFKRGNERRREIHNDYFFKNLISQINLRNSEIRTAF